LAKRNYWSTALNPSRDRGTRAGFGLDHYLTRPFGLGDLDATGQERIARLEGGLYGRTWKNLGAGHRQRPRAVFQAANTLRLFDPARRGQGKYILIPRRPGGAPKPTGPYSGSSMWISSNEAFISTGAAEAHRDSRRRLTIRAGIRRICRLSGGLRT